MIRIIVGGISREIDLRGMFQAIEDYSICFDGIGRPPYRNSDVDWRSVWSNFTSGSSIMDFYDEDLIYNEIIPYPNVFVGWGDAAPGLTNSTNTFPFSVHLRRGDHPEIRWETVAGPNGEKVEVRGVPIVEVRLAVLPIGINRAPEAAFLSRLGCVFFPGLCQMIMEDGSYVNFHVPEIEHQQAIYQPGFPFPSSSAPYGFEPLFETDTWLNENSHLLGVTPPLQFRRSYTSDEFYSRSVRVDRLTSDGCRTLLERSTSDWPGLAKMPEIGYCVPNPNCFLWSDCWADWRREFYNWCNEHQLDYCDEEAFWRYQSATSRNHEPLHIRGPSGSLVATLSASIYHSVEDRRLDKILHKTCEWMCRQISSFCSPIQTQNEKIREQLLERWSQTSQ